MTKFSSICFFTILKGEDFEKQLVAHVRNFKQIRQR